MKAFFKDENKIIFNSMDYTEALVGQAFLDNATGKTVNVEERYDVNDDFDGLVLSVGESIQEQIDKAIVDYEVEVQERIEIAKDEQALFDKTCTQLKYAANVNIAKSTEVSEEDIRTNAEKCSVVVAEDKITVVDEGLVAYAGHSVVEAKKWVGLLIDLNTKVQEVDESDYLVAAHWGASTETTFVLWVNPEQSGETFRFTNVDDETQYVDISLEFTE